MRFQLVKYFTLASLGMFLLIAAAMAYFQGQQSTFFQRVQLQESDFFKQVQDGFARQQEEAAKKDLLTIHESGNVNLTRLFANALWERDFSPFVARAQAIDVEGCRALPRVTGADGKTVDAPERKACYQGIGAALRDFKDFKGLDAKVFDAMKKSTVFKIKVFDMRGITVYSSEHAQMGEDKSANAGWRAAATEGKVLSELVHRDKFSAFEGVVENRDLISSYLPVLQPGSDRIVGVFEVYSDVTPFLNQIKRTSAITRESALKNQQKIDRVSGENQAQVDESSRQALLALFGLLALLFAALFAIVRRAHGIIVKQESDREHVQQHLHQSEKMASLGQMVAGVAHQLNTPLAFCQNNIAMSRGAIDGLNPPLGIYRAFARAVRGAQAETMNVNVAEIKPRLAGIDDEATDVTMIGEMLDDTMNGLGQMRELVENLRDFTRLDRAKVARVDLNKSLRNVVYIARSVIPNRVTLTEDYGPLPEIACNPSQLNQVFLNLINNAAQAIAEQGQVTVRSRADGRHIRIEISDTGSGIPADVLPHIFDTYYTTKPAGEGTGLGLAIAKSIANEHGGDILVETAVGRGSTFTVVLPIAGENAK